MSEANGWRSVDTLPTEEGVRIIALVESEMEWREGYPAGLIRRGYHRVGAADRIVGWKPAPPADTRDGGG